jgi:hypothetical protein
MTRVALPQFFYCWSSHGLFGTGYGVRATTPEMQRWSRDDWVPYTTFCDYIPQAERQGRDEAPVTLARYRLAGGGYLIARKTLTGRRQTYFVHAIVDAEGVVDPLAIAASDDARFWVTSEDGLEPSERTLSAFDALQFAAPAAPPEVPDERLEPLVAHFAGAWSSHQPAVVAGEGVDALPAMRALLALLPRRVAAKVCFSTYEAHDRPGALDLVAARDAAPAAGTPAWVRRLVALARSDPEWLRGLNEDERVAELPHLAAAIEAVHAPLTPNTVHDAVQRSSPFVPELMQRPEFAPALIEAVDANPQWWRSVGFDRLRVHPLTSAVGSSAELLEAAAARFARGKTAAGAALVALYQTIEPDLDGRLRDVEALMADVPPQLAALLLNDQESVPEAAAARWEPWLVSRWSRLGETLRLVPEGLWRRVIRASIMEGEGDDAPALAGPQERLAFELVGELAADPRHDDRAAAFLVMYVVRSPDPAGALTDALGSNLPAAFVRGALSNRLLDAQEVVTPTVARELLRAGVADHAAFRRLVVDPPRRTGPPPPAAFGDPPARRGLWR